MQAWCASSKQTDAVMAMFKTLPRDATVEALEQRMRHIRLALALMKELLIA